MINGYVKQLTWRKFLGSAGKRIGSTCVQLLPNAIISTLPLWLRIPITFATQTSGQYVGKELVLWAISPTPPSKPPPEKEIYIDGFLVIDPDEEMKLESFINEFEIVEPDNNLMIINATLPDQTPNPEIVSYTSACKQYLTDASKSAAHSAMNYVVTMTGADLAEKTGATISSLLATTTFVLVMGPPSLCALPLVFVFEGSVKSMGAYFSRELYEHYSPSLTEAAVNGITNTRTQLTQILYDYLDKPAPSPGLSLDELEEDINNQFAFLTLCREAESNLVDSKTTDGNVLHSDPVLQKRNRI